MSKFINLLSVLAVLAVSSISLAAEENKDAAPAEVPAAEAPATEEVKK